jgi:hypothetical protein
LRFQAEAWAGNSTTHMYCSESVAPSYYLLLSSLELSDTQVYEP